MEIEEALRFQTGKRHPTSPAFLGLSKIGLVRFPENTDRAAGISCRSKHNTNDLSLAGAATSIIFVATNIFLSRQAYFSCDKHVFVATKHVFCRDKRMLVTTKVLSQQAYSCYNKRRVYRYLSQQNICCNKNDTCGNSHH